ncbi:TRAP transporter small permease [Mesorhizobium sp. IMUNJ 23232]|uniref:TRAP transporter small permease n=1 Tax=Mesorhizobium sp. IMUNJ 23232 TaxID=3376064 RepID=UPI0037992F05
MAEEHHTQVTAEEIAQAFEEEAAPVDLSHHGFEDWVTLAMFWVMVACVFLQFFTRYALNNSLAWTEEIAINALVVVVFLGAAMCVRTSRHIHVDVLYHYLPERAGRVLALSVDVIRVGFFAYASWLMWRYVSIVARERMVTVDLPRRWFFYLVLAGFVLMFIRSIQVAISNYKRGYSVLERPGAFDQPGA